MSRLLQHRVHQVPPAPVVGSPFGAPRVAHWHPYNRELNVMLPKLSMDLNDSYRPANTAKQFDNKALEHFDCCDKVYSHDPCRQTPDKDKIFRYKWHQCFREKKTRGGSLATQTEGTNFNLDECQAMMSEFPNHCSEQS